MASDPSATPGRTARVLAAERRIALVARVLDDLVAIPGTRSRVGLDPLIGLVPFLGDAVGALVAGWIVLEAARFRLPGVVIARMVVNVALDVVVGLVPLVGDLFDLGFKANARNLALFRRHALEPGASTSASAAFVGGIVLLAAALAWITAVLLGRLLALTI